MIRIVVKFQNSLLEYCDTVKKFIEKLMEQSIMNKFLMNARKVIRRFRILVRRNEEAIRPRSALVT